MDNNGNNTTPSGLRVLELVIFYHKVYKRSPTRAVNWPDKKQQNTVVE